MAETWLVKGEFPGPEEVLFLPQAPLSLRAGKGGFASILF